MRNYLIITLGYWGFTLTDGAIRMLVLLYFHELGYSPLEIAMLFIFYEFFGVITNLVGGWLGARLGLNLTMHIGMALQIIALSMLAIEPDWLSVPYVMFAQALSGIAKDLNKMSAKAGVKTCLPQNNTAEESRLFRWVAVLTGSKNALKGAGFFLGAALLSTLGFANALWFLAGGLAVILVITWILLPNELGKSKNKPKFSQIFSKTPEINWLSAARFFLFGARDIWFVVALPVFLAAGLGWSHWQVGATLALWIIAYGLVQAGAPRLFNEQAPPTGRSLVFWALGLSLVPLLMILGFMQGLDATRVLLAGLAVFGIGFAINSALHSYLIVSYSDRDKVSLNVGFYYMANAGGRLIGTLLSGWVLQAGSFLYCLAGASIFLVLAALLSLPLGTRTESV